jgi:hypothetical protein
MHLKRKFLPEIPCPLVQPPAQRAPINNKNPPMKLLQTFAPYLSFKGNSFDEYEETKLPKTIPIVNNNVKLLFIPEQKDSNDGINSSTNLIRHN